MKKLIKHTARCLLGAYISILAFFSYLIRPMKRFEDNERQETTLRSAAESINDSSEGVSLPSPSFKGKPSTLQAKSGVPDDVMGKMESALGADFSSVNIHADSSAAKNVGALAYAQGNDVHFAPGQFKPETQAGQELLGHELTHVVQQREGRVKPTAQVNGLALNNDPKLEQEADDLGKRAANA